jgi:hypothetical protein
LDKNYVLEITDFTLRKYILYTAGKQTTLLYVFFWVFSRRQIVICRCFGTLCQFHLQRLGLVLYTQPFKMELTDGAETSANHNLTPGKYPKEHIQYSKHGESLKSRNHIILASYPRCFLNVLMDRCRVTHALHSVSVPLGLWRFGHAITRQGLKANQEGYGCHFRQLLMHCCQYKRWLCDMYLCD